jgi:hypothetical protein
MTVSVGIPQSLAQEIDSAARLPVETAGVMLADVKRSN